MSEAQFQITDWDCSRAMSLYRVRTGYLAGSALMPDGYTAWSINGRLNGPQSGCFVRLPWWDFNTVTRGRG